MTEYEASRRMPAPPEQVFDVACDLQRMDDWLPRDVHLESADPPEAEVVVCHGADAERERALIRAQRDQLRVEWGTRDTDEYAGWLQVFGIQPEGSDVTIHLSFFDDEEEGKEEQGPPRPMVEAALRQSLDRLAEMVGQRESAGG